jgi:hypothetical protein
VARERNGVMTEAFKSIEQGLKEAIAKYAVWVEVDTNEGMYVSADRPFTYVSDPLLFDDKAAAEEHAKLWRQVRWWNTLNGKTGSNDTIMLVTNQKWAVVIAWYHLQRRIMRWINGYQ